MFFFHHPNMIIQINIKILIVLYNVYLLGIVFIHNIIPIIN